MHSEYCSRNISLEMLSSEYCSQNITLLELRQNNSRNSSTTIL